jgi:hypothetical protein
MSRVLNKLPSKDLAQLFQSAPKAALPRIILNLMRMFKNKKVRVASLTAAVSAMDEDAVLALLRTSAEEVFAAYPQREPAMGQKLADLARSLPKHPDEFTERLKLIVAGQHLMSDDQHLRAATAWDTCRRQIQEVARLQKPDPSIAPPMRVKLLDSACRDLAKAADQAMSEESPDGESSWTQKRDALLRISQEVLGGLPLFLPGPWEHEELLKRIGLQFQQHRWPMEPLKKDTAAKKEGPRRLVGPEERSLSTTSRGTMYAVLGLLVVVMLGVTYWVYTIFFPSGSGSTRPGKQGPTRTREGPQRLKKPPSFPAGKPTTMWPALAPEDRPLVAQAAQANLTAAILQGIRADSAWRDNGVMDWQSTISHQPSVLGKLKADS